MKHVEGNLKGVREVIIYDQGWLSAADVKALLLIIHGVDDHFVLQ